MSLIAASDRPTPPERLVDPGLTTPRLGLWDAPLPNPNIEDASFRHAWDWLPGPLERAVRRGLRQKRWQFVHCTAPGWLLSCAVADAGYAGNAFVYAVNTRTGAVHRKLVISPFAAGVRVGPSSREDEQGFRGRGCELRIANHAQGRHLVLQGRGRFDGPGARDFEFDLQFESEAQDEHAALCVPLPEGRWSYTHKFGGFRVRGVARIAGEALRFDPAQCLGSSDYSRQAALRHTMWRWVALATVLPEGRRFALNLVQPTPGEQQGLPTENLLWIDGRSEPLRHASLDVDAVGWRVQADGLQLIMRPRALYRQQLRVPMLSHRLDHHVGAFSGFAETRMGRIELREVFGIAEDNDTWW